MATPSPTVGGQHPVTLVAFIQQRTSCEDHAYCKARIGERARSIEARKAENAAADRSEAFIEGLRKEIATMRATKDEALALEAARNTTPQDSGIAEQLLREREALRAKADAQKEADAAAATSKQKELAEAERIASVQKRELQALEERKILLEQGKEAAKAYRLEQEGLSRDAAADIAARESALDDQSRKNEISKEPLQATESRLMTRGTGSDPQSQVAANTAKLAASATQQLKALNDMVAEQTKVVRELQKLPIIKTVSVP